MSITRHPGTCMWCGAPTYWDEDEHGNGSDKQIHTISGTMVSIACKARPGEADYPPDEAADEDEERDDEDDT